MPENKFDEKVKYIELHPTNNCIFKCPWCTYLQFRERERETLDINIINKVIDLEPKFLLFCGGGDPSSYSTHLNGKRFGLAELISHIISILPEVKIQIGTHAGFPKRDANLLNCLVNADHVGISLDAAYEASRGPSPGHNNWDTEAFKRTLQNISQIVVARTEKKTSTYICSTFTKENWVNLFRIAQALFEKLKSETEDPSNLKVKFGCTSVADDSRSYDPYYPSRLGDSEKNNWGLLRRLIRNLNLDFSKFIGKKTNLYKPTKDKTTAYGITHCGMVENYVLAAADGHYYPCCVMAARRSCSLGNIADLDPHTLAEKRYQFYTNGTPPLCADGCRVRDHTLMGGKAWD
ncbi:MAG: radical SAM protein [Candidatus Aminicenantes bacterium]|nr:radical SAM protein [Candidatus Aminicenantes bacterium]